MPRQAGVPVTATRYQGIICGVVLLGALRGTQAAEAAISQATVVLRKARTQADAFRRRAASQPGAG
jgi:hypothetical protein